MLTRPQGARKRQAEVTSEPAPRGVPFIEAGFNQCRWPLWETDADPRLVCGAPRVPGSSYCEAHRRRSCERVKVRR